MNLTYGNLYYQGTSLDDLPVQFLSTITRLKIFLASKVFTENNITDAVAKFIVADIISGASDAAVDSAVLNFNTSNPIFPFCAYSYDFTERVDDKKSHLARSGKYFDSTLNAYVSSKPVKNSVPFIFFFNNPKDYYTAQKIIHTIIASPSIKLDVPIIVNNITYYFSINVSFEIEKGTYSGAFIEHMRVGNIFDIILNASVSYNDITMDTTNIWPVDDMIATIYYPDDENDIYNVEEGQAYAPPTPAIATTIPVNNATGISKTANIVVNFSTTMAVDSVIDSLELIPYFQYTAEWNDAGTQLTLSPINPLAGLTLYNIIIHKSAYGFINNEKMEEDGSFSFTTIA